MIKNRKALAKLLATSAASALILTGCATASDDTASTETAGTSGGDSATA